MPRLADLSIRNKLILVIAGAAMLTLIVGFTTVIVRDRVTLRRDTVTRTELIARLAGDYSVGELAFGNQAEAQESLRKLALLPDIDCAQIFDSKGEPFAAYQRDPANPVAMPRLPVQGMDLQSDHLFLSQPIEYEGELFGSILVCASTAALDRQLTVALATMVGLMALLGGLSVALALRLQQVISTPILRLARAARRVSESQDFSLRVAPPGEDEIGTLYQAWNSMLEQIERRQAERERYEQVLREQRRRQEQSNLQLARYTHELERSNQELDQFAYIVSHDLKAPLRAIINLSEWLEEDLAQYLNQDTRHQMNLLRGRTRRMESLIDGILEYSRVIRRKSPVEEVDVGSLLREVVADLPRPEGFAVTIQAAMPVLTTPRVRLAQVFSNLISNAIKYHDRPDGKVDILGSDLGDSWEFQIRDDGPGIAPEFHEKIFLIFQTLQRRDVHESTGIGLALVKKIVEERGGHITVESDNLQGASFRFTWPKEAGEDL